VLDGRVLDGLGINRLGINVLKCHKIQFSEFVVA